MRHWRWYSKVLLALLVAAFAYFVWPTPWVPYSRSTEIIRVHRVTGHTQVLLRRGWRDRASIEKFIGDARADNRTDREIAEYLINGEGLDSRWAWHLVTSK